MLATRLRQLFALGLLTCGLIGVGTALAQQFGTTFPSDPNLPPPGAWAADPVGGLYLSGQEKQEKQQEPKKVAAKGIEDDDVPYGSFPAQAVVRIEDGKLIVRQRGYQFEVVKQKVGDQTVTSYQRKSGVNASTHDPADVAVFDMKGNRLAAKEWKAQLKNDVHALVAHDGRLPNPRELTLFKQDTLLIVLPAANTPVYTTGQGAYAPAAIAPPAQYQTAPAIAPSGTTPFPAPRAAPVPRPDAVLPPRAAPAPRPDAVPPLPADVRGTLTSDLADGTVRISIGFDAGLEVNSKLDVYRETNGVAYLGTLTVTALMPEEAVCAFKPARPVALDKLRAEELPRKGDTVGRISPPTTGAATAPAASTR